MQFIERHLPQDFHASSDVRIGRRSSAGVHQRHGLLHAVTNPEHGHFSLDTVIALLDTVT